jgi:hypothetical protein
VTTLSPEERCRQEIAAVTKELRAGATDLDGLLRALVDWSLELRMLESRSRINVRPAGKL